MMVGYINVCQTCLEKVQAGLLRLQLGKQEGFLRPNQVRLNLPCQLCKEHREEPIPPLAENPRRRR
jgi:hypothetical protein